MTNRKFAHFILAVGLFFSILGMAQLIFPILDQNGLPLMAFAAAIFLFAGGVASFLNRTKRSDGKGSTRG